MWKPDESLDDFTAKLDAAIADPPPRKVRVHVTGETETLQPLLSPTKTRRRWRSNPQPIWFQQAVAIGSVALVMIAFALVTAILIGINEPGAESEIAMNMPLAEMQARIEEPFNFDTFNSSSVEAVSTDLNSVRSNVRRKRARSNVVHVAGHKPRQEWRPLVQTLEQKFSPTTLVIYAENGVIKSRIEPWL